MGVNRWGIDVIEEATNMKFKNWTLTPCNPNAAAELESAGIPPLSALVLAARGFDQGAQAKEFLSCAVSRLHDPMTMKGMPEAVERLRAAGVRTAVLSNKAHALAGPVVEDYYPGQFPWVQGALPGLPTKPDPTLLHRLMEQMGASPEDTLFVGDSDVDIRTARNGGLTSCGVLWGFRGRAELEAEGADCLARTPEELVKAVLGDG